MTNVRDAFEALDVDGVGATIHDFAAKAFPIGRSITGDGVRETLALLSEIVPVEVHEVPSGTEVFDWQVPSEWSVREAWIKDADGATVVDVANHNLHLLGYSVPFSGTLTRDALDPHLYSLPEQPTLIPYRTSYYQERWGFCLPHARREQLGPGPYEVRVDTRLEPGHLTYGEVVLPGESDETMLISAHICHPSLANDNLSGVGVAAHLARVLSDCTRRYTYRIVFVPGTIGAITWLARNADAVSAVRGGLVAANLGDGGAFHYKRSQQGDAEIDRAVAKVLADRGEPFVVEDFLPFGYDERQYNAPGFDLPVGLLSRTPWGRFPEYHTSADDLGFIRPRYLGDSLARYLEIVSVLESNRTYRNLKPYGEPQLGKRGLYRTLGGDERGRERELALLWVLNQSNGERSLLDIAARADRPYGDILEAARALRDADLLA